MRLIDWLRDLRSQPRLAEVIDAAPLILIGWAAGRQGYDAASNLAMMLAAARAGYPIAKRAVFSLRFGIVGIEFLVTLAAVGAMVIGEFWEAAVVVWLFALGGYLEARTSASTRRALRELTEKQPQKAMVFRNGEFVEVRPEDVEKGERVAIKPGARVPVDGTVVEGTAAVDESALTGEPLPRSVAPGEEVLSGSVLTTGYLQVRTAAAGRDTTFARIIELIEEAQERKAPTERFIERFARYYTPIIVALSVVTYAVTRDAHQALTFLVIACPGALVIATPISIVAGIGTAARQGILIKGGDILERAAQADVVAFDKTGTLTTGKPRVTAIRTVGDTTRDELLLLAASVEQFSEHPLANAVLQAAKQRGLEPRAAADFQHVTGHGVRALVERDGEHVAVAVGSHGYMEKLDMENPDDLQPTGVNDQAGSVVWVAVAERVIAVLTISDELREEAAPVLHRLRENGMKSVLLTGDNETAARQITLGLELSQLHAGLLPEDKVELVERLQSQGHVVAMIGDGINDGPALATADVSIAMGHGTDTALEVADIALVSGNLSRLPEVFSLSSRTRNNLRQNIALALLTVGGLLAGVWLNSVHLASGMLVHEASVLGVTLNALRLLRTPRGAAQ